ncbi:ABC transporter permease subunit, partial [Achromobacter xylosoxidans]|uniref:ABC transporter permease subunit n=1 Tax=Alcaligenes xylosoxydans xylosoxydans TaxID=85698 RepID=UPI003D0904F3
VSLNDVDHGLVEAARAMGCRRWHIVRHVLLPGDAVGPWRLQAIEGNTAVFQAGNQTRRVAIP